MVIRRLLKKLSILSPLCSMSTPSSSSDANHSSDANIASCFSSFLSTIFDLLKIQLILIQQFILLFIPGRYHLLKNVSNEVVLITGGGSGIGAILARKFSQLGSTVIIWDINESALESVRSSIESFGGICHAYKVDIANRKLVYEMAFKVKNDIGKPVTMLINNAGIVSGDRIDKLSDDAIIKTFNVNIMSMFWTVRAFLPAMKALNHGHIVNVASLAGTVGLPILSDYCASKFAVIGLSESVFQKVRADGYDGINGTLVLPSLIDTGLFQGAKVRLVKALPPEDVAETIMYGIRTNETIIYLPSWTCYILAFKNILPTDASLIIGKIFGFDTFMSGFTGRHGKDANQNSN